MQIVDHPQGDYRFLTGIAPYSSSVIAQPGFVLIRAQFAAPVPIQPGFEQIASYLAAQGRPRQALCAMELRLPAPLSFEEFIAFNASYRTTLEEWNIPVGNLNPVARTNVAPAAAAPPVPSLYAFTFTAPLINGLSEPTFVVAGAGDLRDQADLTPAAIVRPGDTSHDGLLEKANVVMEVMSERLHGISVDWPQVSTVNIYTPHSLDHFLEPVLLPTLGSIAVHGVHWYYSRPPIAGLEYEMDLRHVGADYRLA
ncbi:MAG: RidA family protein [Caldilineaceae bacterium]|nr:RidA family protein [Caldilineaceae bacterium]